MPIESGFKGGLKALSGVGDWSGRGRKVEDRSVSVATAHTHILEANNNRIWAILINSDTTNFVDIRLGETAVANTGFRLFPNGGWLLINADMAWTGEVNGIADTAACVIQAVECSIQGATDPPAGGSPGSPPGTDIRNQGC